MIQMTKGNVMKSSLILTQRLILIMYLSRHRALKVTISLAIHRVSECAHIQTGYELKIKHSSFCYVIFLTWVPIREQDQCKSI